MACSTGQRNVFVYLFEGSFKNLTSLQFCAVIHGPCLRCTGHVILYREKEQMWCEKLHPASFHWSPGLQRETAPECWHKLNVFEWLERLTEKRNKTGFLKAWWLPTGAGRQCGGKVPKALQGRTLHTPLERDTEGGKEPLGSCNNRAMKFNGTSVNIVGRIHLSVHKQRWSTWMSFLWLS